MKTPTKLISLLFVTLLLCNYSLYAHAWGGYTAKGQPLEEQIAAFIQYPEALKIPGQA